MASHQQSSETISAGERRFEYAVEGAVEDSDTDRPAGNRAHPRGSSVGTDVDGWGPGEGEAEHEERDVPRERFEGIDRDDSSVSEAYFTQLREKQRELDLTEKQIETLRAIFERPTATQAEIAELFDVTKSTICQRVNSIDGFTWQLRKSFVDALFLRDDGPDSSKDEGDSTVAEDEGPASRRNGAEDGDVRRERSRGVTRNGGRLEHKIVLACLRSDCITEEEELKIISKMM